MTFSQRQFLKTCAACYCKDLVMDILSFWQMCGLDCNGMLMNTAKSVWFQGRFGYVCALDHIEKNLEWLATTSSCLDFIKCHCIDTDGYMFFTVTTEEIPVQKRHYVFSESFAITAMVGYALESGNRTYAEKSLSIFKNTQWMLSTLGFLPAKTTVQDRSHVIMMILMSVAHILKQVCNAFCLDEQIKYYLLNHEYKTLLETVTSNGLLIDTCVWRTINPSHCIDMVWFVLEITCGRADKAHLRELVLTIYDWTCEWRYDREWYGNLHRDSSVAQPAKKKHFQGRSTFCG